MKKKLLLTLFLSTSLFSQSFNVSSLCEASFLKTYASYGTNSKLEIIKAASVNDVRKILKDQDISTKIQKLEKQYNLLSREYRDKINQLEKEFTKIGKEFGLDFREIQKNMVGLKQEIYIETLDQLNAITFVTYKSLIGEGMQVALKKRPVKGSKKLSSYIEVVSTPSKKYYSSIATINRYKQRFGTKTVTFDFAQNMKNGSAGFSQAITKRIDLGFRGMRNMVLDDLITMVGKHEFKHASFAAKRIKGRDSIYHAQYISYKESPISSVKNHYNRYMSAEELYNFTNNPFWASNRIGDISKFKKIDYLNDVNGIYYYIKQTNKIAAQTKEVTERTVRYLKTLLKYPKRFAGEMRFLTAEKTLAKHVDEAFYIQFQLPDGVVYMDWIGASKFGDDLAIVLRNRAILDRKYRPAFEAATGRKKQNIFEEYAKEEMSVNSFRNKEILKEFISKQETLNKVATNIIPLNREVVRKTEDFMSFYMMRKRLEPNYLKTAEAKQRFLKLRLMYRKLGNHVKEDFKGFVGR